MKILSSIVLSFALSLTFIPQTKAEDSTIVAGTTSDGSRLALLPSTVHLDADGISRNFDYLILRKDGTIIARDGASTVWCRHGKIQIDKRIHNIPGSHTIPINTPNAFTQPGWWVYIGKYDQKYITADSPASRNLLKAVCAT